MIGRHLPAGSTGSKPSLAAVLIMLLSAGALAAPEPGPASPSQSVEQLIADLDSDRFAVRQRAMSELLQVGAEAVEPLTEAARDGSIELQIRTARILQGLFVGDDPDAAQAAMQALESLAEDSSGRLAARAEQVLDANYRLREKRALAQIEKLGGTIHHEDDDQRARRLVNRPDVMHQGRPVEYILLGPEWQGGDEGLKYIRRLKRLKVLYISKGKNGVPVSEEAERDLKAARPNLIIQHRGLAYLGIGGATHPRGCQVAAVKPGTAAAQAGLRKFDVITGFGGKPIPDFETLIERIKQYAPGDKVKVEILRGSRRLTLKVVMGKWE